MDEAWGERYIVQAIKVIGMILVLAIFANGQLVVPDAGWEMIEKGEEGKERERFLGGWQNVEKSVQVRASWMAGLLNATRLLGTDSGAGGVDPTQWPVKAELLRKPELGVRLKFGASKNEAGEREEHYWLYGKEGGVVLKVLESGKDKFSLEGWGLKEPVVDKDGEVERSLMALVDWINAERFTPTIKIESDVMPPLPSEAKEVGELESPRIRVEIRVGPEFRVDGNQVTEVELKAILKKASDEDGEMVLHIAAEKELEFKHVQGVIKLAISVGIDQLAYGGASLEKNESDK